MRILYFCLCLLFTVALSAQENFNFNISSATEASEIKLYPNPAYGGVVNILTKANTDKQVRVYDVFGELVLTTKISRKTLDISRLVSGVYVLQVNENGKTFTRKLVVK